MMKCFDLLPRRMLAIGCTLALGSFPAMAENVSWTAPPSQSAAWLGTANWDLNRLPTAGDVALFNHVAGETIGYSMAHASNPTRHEGHVGAVWVQDSRVTRDLVINSHSGSANVFYYHGATVGTISRAILVNDSDKNLSLTSTGGGAASVGLAAGLQSAIVLRGAGNITLNLPISGSQSSLRVTASGSGRVELAGGASTYSGGTVLSSGRLLLSANQAAGTGAISNLGGTLEVAAGVVITNAITLENTTAIYQRHYTQSDTFTSYRMASAPGANQTAVALAGGNASQSRTLLGSFAATSSALNDDLRRGDLVSLTGTGGDLYVLTLSVASSADAMQLGWQDGDLWRNAVEGNSATGALALKGFAGSFEASGALVNGDYLGSWGFDADNGAVWAMVDHGGSFAAVVPEPASLVLLTGGVGFMLLLRRRNGSSIG